MRRGSAGFELELFEQVHAAPGVAMLRIVGLAHPQIASSDDAILTLAAGRRSYRLTALPGPPPRDSRVQLSFLAPRALLSGAFTLDVGELREIELPKPKRTRNVRPQPARRADGPMARLEEARTMVITTLEDALAEKSSIISELEAKLQEAEERAAIVPQLTAELEQMEEQLRRFQDRSRAQQAKVLLRIEKLEAQLAKARAAVQPTTQPGTRKAIGRITRPSPPEPKGTEQNENQL